MKKIIVAVMMLVFTSHIIYAASTHYNFKKEAYSGTSQINFAALDMKNIKEVELTFVGMEFNSQGWADFVPLNKPVTLYASCSTDLRVRYKNRPSYEYDTKINKKDVHFKAKNYFYWNSYLQLVLLQDKKHASKLRCKFNGIENSLSSYIVEKASSKDDSRTFKYIKRVKNKVETLDYVLVSDLKEVPVPIKYCADNLVCCKYNVHFGSGKPLFGKGKANEVKDVTVTFYATIQSMLFADENKVTFKTAPKPKNEMVVLKSSNKSNTANKKTISKPKTKTKTSQKKNVATKSKTTTEIKGKSNLSETSSKSDISSAVITEKELAPRTDAELDDDLVAEVIFVTGAENSLKDESSIAPRTDSQLDDDLVGD